MVLVLLGSLSLASAEDETPMIGKVVKVLPLLLNLQGHDALSPSLFDRDAYQLYLRLHTNEISGIRYDVEWKAQGTVTNRLDIHVELRAVGPDGSPRLKTLMATVKPNWFWHWTTLTLANDEYQKFGNIVAWRASLWAGDHLISEQKSFLW